MNTAEVAEVLRNTLQTDAATRKEAERQLARVQSHIGYGMALLELLSSPQVPAEIRVVAAVVLKNFVKTNWGENPEVEVGDVEQDQLRTALLAAMFANTGNLQKQLSHAVFLMAKKDFPERWPELINGLASQMNTANADLERLLAALNTMDQLLEKYRYESKSESLWRELKMCLLAVQAPLTTLYEWLVGFVDNLAQLSAEQANSLFELLNCVMRVFHSLCTQDLPEFFEDNLSRWVAGMAKLFTIEAPSVQSAGGEATPLDKVKTEMCEIVTLYAQRYEEEIMPHMQGLIGAIWQLLVNTNSETRYDGMVCSALDFLSAICVRSQYKDMFKADGVLKTLAEDVAVKNLMLRQEDLEQFEDEPLEYIKKDLEGTDSGTRRKGAVDLVRALCREYEGDLMPILSAVVSSFIADASDQFWRKRDVVYCLVRAMASKTETSRQGATSTSQLINIVDYYSSNVRGDLCAADVNSFPILKADALKFVVLFRNQLPPEAHQEALVAIENLFTSQHTIVHKYAAYAVERLLLVRVNNTPIFTAASVNVASLLARLIAAFDADPKAQNSAYLIKALMRVVCIIDASTARQAGEIATRLAAMVDAAVKNPADPSHTHFLFETICLLVKKTSGHVEGGIDRPLFPLLETILAQDVADLVPYALQVIALLLSECSSRGAPTDAYLAFLPHLLTEALWAKTANVPAALVVIESFLRVHPQLVMAQHGVTLMGHYQRLIALKSLDHYGFALANAMLPHVDHITGMANPLHVLLNNMFRRVQQSKTPKFAKAFVVFFFRFCVVMGAPAVANVLEAIQAGMFRMIIEKVIGPEMEKLADATTHVEKRICAIGLAEMMESGIGVLGDLFGPLSEAGVKLCEGAVVHGSHANEEDEQASMYSEEGEFNAAYCKLQNAAPAEVLRPEITNWKKYFSDVVLKRIGGSQPAMLACLPEHTLVTLGVYSV
ncbi:xpo-2 [Pristionchus pacificus]|uniref:Exportin-2 n=1 Tax=Pristionchus pacificus TaxID=54126 RepID=A0A2A6BEN4_PRIPA|nr:xpo-2 [Pristionchus pacificus]|eukprot:PDM64271.1 xpo-2 [Pristionchus pacificus]